MAVVVGAHPVRDAFGHANEQLAHRVRSYRSCREIAGDLCQPYAFYSRLLRFNAR